MAAILDVNSRPSDDKSPLKEEKIDIVAHGVITIEDEPKNVKHRWAIWETLGEGGFGIVTRGVSINKDHSVVALKFMRRTEDLQKGQLARLDKAMTREVAALTEIQHENVIRMHHHFNNAEFLEPDYSTTDSTLLVLEYASKGSLKDFLKSTGYFTDTLARTYFEQMLSGLEAMHVKGFAHHDLKPSNMLIDENYTLKIADFGLAKKFYDEEQKKDIAEAPADNGFVYERAEGGTVKFLAPEVNMKSMCYGNQVDIFALGVTLFILYFDRPPFAIADATQDAQWRLLCEASVREVAQEDWSDVAPKDMSSVQVKCPAAAQIRKKFWEEHKLANFDGTDLATLLIAMMHPHSARRYNIVQVRQSEWLSQGERYKKPELKEQMDLRWTTLCTHKQT